MGHTVQIIGILFLTIVVPLWLILHYVSHWRSSRVLSKEDTRMLEDLWESAQKMEDRIESLETILESEHHHRSSKP